MMSDNRFGTIIQIGDDLISEEVVTEYFACDYPKCKGICCVLGDSGAPLEEAETDQLERHYGEFSDLMSEEGRKAVDDKGFFCVDIEGDLVTTTAPGPDRREPCAYCLFEGENVFCSIERRWFEKKCSFRKPASCWLYPIRIKKSRSGGRLFNLDRQAMCRDAFEKGRREGTRVYQFLKEPLTELFGEDFYSALDAAAKHING